MAKAIQVWNLAGGKINRKDGVIEGCSIMTMGEALGWEAFCDMTTLQQIMAVGGKFKGGIKVKAGHFSGENETVASIPASSLRIDGQQLRGDLKFLKSKQAASDYWMEMAEEMPDTFGLSAVFRGTPQMVDNKKMLRCEEIASIDLVDRPASNPNGLLSIPDDAVDTSKNNNPQNISLFMDQKDIDQFKALLEPMTAKIVALEAKINAPVATAPVVTPAPAIAPVVAPAAPSTDEIVNKAVIAALSRAGISPSSAPAPAPAAATPPPVAAKKTFPQVVEEVALERKMTRGEATSFCVKNFTALYADYRENTLGVRYIDEKQKHTA